MGALLLVFFVFCSLTKVSFLQGSLKRGAVEDRNKELLGADGKTVVKDKEGRARKEKVVNFEPGMNLKMEDADRFATFKMKLEQISEDGTKDWVVQTKDVEVDDPEAPGGKRTEKVQVLELDGEEELTFLGWVCGWFLECIVKKEEMTQFCHDRGHLLSLATPSDIAFIVLVLHQYRRKFVEIARLKTNDLWHDGDSNQKNKKSTAKAQEDRLKKLTTFNSGNALSGDDAQDRYRRILHRVAQIGEDQLKSTYLNKQYWNVVDVLSNAKEEQEKSKKSCDQTGNDYKYKQKEEEMFEKYLKGGFSRYH